MKKIRFLAMLAFVGLSSAETFAQTVNIPDANFKAALVANLGINTNFDGEIQISEATAVTGMIYVSSKSISNLKGIEAFTSITSLDCSANQLTSLNLSANTAITSLDCNNNQLTGLNILANTALTVLSCYDNQLTSLNVSANSALTTLYCYNNNQLTSLNLKNGNNINLTSFIATNTPNLSCINVDSAAFMDSNWSGAKDATASYNGDCIVNITNAAFKNSLLNDVNINTNFDGEIQISEATATGGIYINSSSISDLTGIEAFTAITTLDCGYNQLTSLNLSFNMAITNLSCFYNQLTSLEFSANSALTALNCSGNLLTSLNISGNTALTNLNCSSNQLTSLDLSANTALTDLDCSSNPFTSFDISANTALINLSCDSYNLTSLNISTNTALTTLSCNSNQLTSLNLSANTALTNLSCFDNQLTSLNLSANTALTALFCNANLLTSLDLSANTALTTLYCGSNQLTSLNLSTNTALVYLNCGYNQLTSLNLSANTALTGLHCFNNQLTSLNLSANTALTGLHCYFNQLTSLNLSTNTALTAFKSNNNLLTSLNIKNGNNINFTLFNVTANPGLGCIQVDNRAWSTTNWAGGIGASASFCTDCTPVYIPDAIFKTYLLNNTSINTNSDSIIQTSEAVAYTGTIMINYMSISDLTGIEAFPAITDLACNNNLLTSLNLTANTALTYLVCGSNQLTSLDLSANTALNYFDCSNNQLTSLNVKNGNNTNFTVFTATGNPNLNCIKVDSAAWSTTNWTSIDAGTSFSIEECCIVNIPNASFKNYLLGNTSINTNSDSHIQCSEAAAFTGTINISNYNGVITDLTGIEAFTAFTYFLCPNNQFTSLDLSANTALTSLHCNNNLLTNLNLSANTALTIVNCNTNQLTSLNLSANTALTYLVCNTNLLTSLDLSSNTALSTFSCNNNQLTSLNLSVNTALTNVNCNTNQLTSLDLSADTALTNLDCSGNQLTSLNVKNGNNYNMPFVDATNNPSLSCITVDNPSWSTVNWPNFDAGTSFSLNCSPCIPTVSSQTFVECAGFSVTVGTNTHTTTGIYTDVLVNATGCDSTVTTDLTINGTIDITTTLNGATITANQAGANYQWLDCNNSNTPIAGANSQSYIATNGNYALAIMQGSCSDTSACVTVNINNCFANYTTSYDSIQNIFSLTIDTATSAMAVAYHWDFGDGTTSAIPNPTHTVTTDTVYNVCMNVYTAAGDSCTYCHLIGKDYLGNITRTDGFTLIVIDPNTTTGFAQTLPMEAIAIYPNPSNGAFAIQSTGEGVYSIINELGQTIQSVKLNAANNYSMNVENLSNGLYFITGYNNNQITKKKIVVTK